MADKKRMFPPPETIPTSDTRKTSRSLELQIGRRRHVRKDAQETRIKDNLAKSTHEPEVRHIEMEMAHEERQPAMHESLDSVQSGNVEKAGREPVEKIVSKRERICEIAVNLAPNAMSLVRLNDGVFVFVNRKWLNIFGFTKEEALGKTIDELGISCDEEAQAFLQAEVISKGFVRNREISFYRTKYPDNPIFLLDMEVVNIAARNYLYTSLRDISMRKRMERELFTANQRLTALMNALPLGISFSDDVTCRNVVGNPALLALFEATGEDNVSATAPDPAALGPKVRYFQGGRELKGTELPLQRAAAEHRQIPPMELEILLPGGRHWFAEVAGAPLHDREGKVTGGVAVVMDISERKRIEVELQQSENRYRRLFENMVEEVHYWQIIRDENGCIKTWRLIDINPPALKAWGKTREEIINKTVDEFFPNARDHFMPVVEKIMTEGVAYSYESYFPDLEQYLRLTSVPVGECFITTGADVTAIKKASVALQQAHDELELRVRERTRELEKTNEERQEEIKKRKRIERELKAKNRSLSEEQKQRKYLSKKLVETLEKERRDIANALHDNIGQMMVTIKSSLGCLMEKLKTSPELAEDVENINNEVSELLVCIKNAAASIRPHILDNLGLIPSLQNMLETVQTDSKIQCHFFAKGIPDTLSEEKKLTVYRIIQEAVTNCQKHAKADNLYVSLIRKGKKIFLAIEDDGVGFSGDVNSCFGEEALRLGIMIMKERVLLVGGKLHVESQTGRGSQVIADIPVD